MNQNVDIKIAKTPSEIDEVMALRREIFVKENGVSEEKEFDGNDFVGCVHFYAKDKEKIVGCLRARFASNIAKLERLCVKKEYRKTMVATQLMDFACSFCEYKGYDKVTGYCTEHLLPHWIKFGFSVCKDIPTQKIDNMELYTIQKDLSPSSGRVSIKRPETLLNADDAMAQKDFARRQSIKLLDAIRQYKQKTC